MRSVRIGMWLLTATAFLVASCGHDHPPFVDVSPSGTSGADAGTTHPGDTNAGVGGGARTGHGGRQSANGGRAGNDGGRVDAGSDGIGDGGRASGGSGGRGSGGAGGSPAGGRTSAGGPSSTGGTGGGSGGAPVPETDSGAPGSPHVVQHRVLPKAVQVQRVFVDSNQDVLLVGKVNALEGGKVDGVDFMGNVDGVAVLKLSGKDYSLEYAKIFRGMNPSNDPGGATSNSVTLVSAALTPEDDLVLLGTTTGFQLDFGGGAIPPTNAGGTYLVKLSSSGDYLSAQTLSSSAEWTDVAVDENGSILMALRADSSFAMGGVTVPAVVDGGAPAGAMKLGKEPTGKATWAALLDDANADLQVGVRAAAPGLVLVAGNNHIGRGYVLSALNPGDGSILWTASMPNPDDYVFAASNFDVLRMGDRAIFLGRFYGTITVGNEQLTYQVSTEEAKVVGDYQRGMPFLSAFSVDTGSALWATKVDPFGFYLGTPRNLLNAPRLARIDDQSFAAMVTQNVYFAGCTSNSDQSFRYMTAIEKYDTAGHLLGEMRLDGFRSTCQLTNAPPTPETVLGVDIASASGSSIVVTGSTTGLSIDDATGTFVVRIAM